MHVRENGLWLRCARLPNPQRKIKYARIVSGAREGE